MKTLTKILIPLFLISNNLYAFTLNNSASIVFAKDEVKINIAANTCSNIGIDETELLSIASDAVNLYWNKAPTSRLKLRAGSVKNVISDYKTGEICNPSTSCDPNPTLAVESDILIACNNNTTNFSSNAILAVTVPNNFNANTIIGSLILINDIDKNQFYSKSRSEKVSIIAHEIGHAFGLGHSPVSDSLMYYRTVDLRTNLGSDDIDGISYLYPKQQPIACGTITEKTNPNQWLGLAIGFLFIYLISKFQFRYLKLRPRF